MNSANNLCSNCALKKHTALHPHPAFGHLLPEGERWGEGERNNLS